MMQFILVLLWLTAGMAGNIVARYRAGVTNVFTVLAFVLGLVWLAVALLLPARPTSGAPRVRIE
jgi:cytochrome c oxidase assembly factor CtaG